jgi:ubiquinone/menaquinone biosynthesis C-methylase UbiE
MVFSPWLVFVLPQWAPTAMSRSPRVEYDKIAHLYDSQPHRTRSVDPELLAFMRERTSREPVSLLDIACGTGNQLVANRAAAPDARLAGADQSLGMLRQARAKAPDIAWVRADAAMLPFQSSSFDFISCQFAFHHFRHKAGMLGEALRLLRSRRCLILHNMCPEECADWLYYEYFPAARTADLRDFWPIAKLVTAMERAGFAGVAVEYEHVRFEQNLSDWLDTVRRRDICSQLQAIPDAAYAAGLRRLERAVADPTAPRVRADHLCLVTIRGEKP